MSSTQEDPPNSYMITEGDDFVPKNAMWTCNEGTGYGSNNKKCGGRNEDIEHKTCYKCGKKRGDGATADLGQKTSTSGERGRFWMLYPNKDGSENWTTNFIDP
ncbi:hypothetical protein LZL87_008729 [Fusarium oxysporum]|nr:hypothetical protein LZL87_008729 [Fusarium oxysporum]